MIQLSIADQIAINADADPERVAVEVIGGPSFTIRDVWRRTIAMAKIVADTPAGPHGKMVGILLPNGADHLFAYLACDAAGVAAVPVNNRLTKSEIEFVLRDSGAGSLLSGGEFTSLAAELANELDIQLVEVENIVEPEEVSFELSGSTIPGDAVSAVAYTSGTTGFPKGLMVGRDARFVQFIRWGWQFGITADDVMLVGGPLFHLSFGGLAQLALMTGARVRIMPQFDAEQACDEFQHRSTFAFLVPTMTAMVLDAWRSEGQPTLGALRFMLSSGASMPATLLEQAIEAFPNATIAEAYGWSEGGWCTYETKHLETLRPHSVGWPMTGWQVVIRDDDGRRCAVGEAGEITVRSMLPFGGYLNRHDANDTIQREGFIRSGDIGILDEDGRIRVVDRKNDMIVTGGENVYTAEVERVLLDHPRIAEAAVVGRLDDRWGHIVVAAVVPDGPVDIEDAQTFCRDNLAGYKVPREVMLLEELPRNAMGKLQKATLRELAEARTPTG